MKRVFFIGFLVDNITKDEILKFVQVTITYHRKYYISVQNTNKIYFSEKIPLLKGSIEKAAIILPAKRN